MVRVSILCSALIGVVISTSNISACAENPLMRMKNAAMSKVTAAQQRVAHPTGTNQKKGTAAKDIRDKWAVLIGVGMYQDPNVSPLKYAFKNTTAITEIFKNIGVGRFAPDHVLAIANAAAKKEAIEQNLTDEWLCKKALPEDLVVLYICTRFVQSPDSSDVMLLANDTPLASASLDGIPLTPLLSNVKRRLQSKRVVAFLDLSPAFKDGSTAGKLDIEKIASDAGVTILSATNGTQQSQNSAIAPISCFTQYICEGMQTGLGTLPLAAIAQYVAEGVNKDAKNIQNKEQTPLFFAAADSPDISDVPLGVRLKSSIPEKSVHIGHPVDQLAMSRPDIITGQPGRMKNRTLIAQAIPMDETTIAQAKTGSEKAVKPAGSNANSTGSTSSSPASATKSAPVKAGSATSSAAKKEAEDDDDDGETQENVDLGPYIKEMKQLIRSKWTPPKGMQDKHVVTVFTIRRNGNIEDPTVVEGSGSDEVDATAIAALKAASPLPKLPKGAPQFIQIRYQFDWKVKQTSGANSSEPPKN